MNDESSDFKRDVFEKFLPLQQQYRSQSVCVCVRRENSKKSGMEKSKATRKAVRKWKIFHCEKKRECWKIFIFEWKGENGNFCVERGGTIRAESQKRETFRNVNFFFPLSSSSIRIIPLLS